MSTSLCELPLMRTDHEELLGARLAEAGFHVELDELAYIQRHLEILEEMAIRLNSNPTRQSPIDSRT